MTTYKEAGVDIENTDALVENISELSKSTNRNGNSRYQTKHSIQAT